MLLILEKENLTLHLMNDRDGICFLTQGCYPEHA